MSNCDKLISLQISSNCANPVKEGLKGLGYIGNYSDLDLASMTKAANGASGTKNNVYSDIKLKNGAKIYKVYQDAKKPFNGAIKEFQEGDYRNTFNKTVPFVILDNGAEICDKIIDPLANGRFFMVLENVHTANDNQFELIGLETGMTVTECTDEKWNESFGGGWSVKLVEEKAPTSGIFLAKTDALATGLSNLEAGKDWSATS